MNDEPETPAERLATLRAARHALDTEIDELEATLGPKVSPLKPGAFPDLPQVAGLTVATGATGSKYRGRDDVLLARLEAGTAIAGTLTRSATRSAPVIWCEGRLAARRGGTTGPAGLIVNAGNANAFTGTHGMAAVERIAAATGEALGTDDVFLASTGVIGEP
ncbi:MAG: bifunctional ornithine acetyltransferase/N-acetylglutamate synthase, partial [Pseudomonadota bacterium]